MAFGVYLHVPFCAHRCPYCDFSFVVRKEPPTERFTQAVLRELDAVKLAPADTVYFGGGTPSLLAGDQLGRILAAIPSTAHRSITLEANPDDTAKFDAFAGLGIQRLSIGVQSLQDRHLRTLGRTHTAATALAALGAASRAFGDVNADLIFGIPGQTVGELLADAQALLDTGVTHISAYGLTVHEGTLLAKAQREGKFRPVVENTEREHFLALDAYLRQAGFEHYEISNYARPGFRSKHNELYWTGASYRGFGPSAHSFDAPANRRYWNLRSYDRWVAAIEAGESPVAEEEILDPPARRLERLYLTLRRSEGLFINELPATEHVRATLQQAQKEGLATVEHDRLRLTPEGMAIADTFVDSLLASVD